MGKTYTEKEFNDTLMQFAEPLGYACGILQAASDKQADLPLNLVNLLLRAVKVPMTKGGVDVDLAIKQARNNKIEANQNPMERLAELAEFVPAAAMFDIKNRIADWIISGGKPNDNYMWQQVRYAENCAKAQPGNGFRG